MYVIFPKKSSSCPPYGKLTSCVSLLHYYQEEFLTNSIYCSGSKHTCLMDGWSWKISHMRILWKFLIAFLTAISVQISHKISHKNISWESRPNFSRQSQEKFLIRISWEFFKGSYKVLLQSCQSKEIMIIIATNWAKLPQRGNRNHKIINETGKTWSERKDIF